MFFLRIGMTNPSTYFDMGTRCVGCPEDPLLEDEVQRTIDYPNLRPALITVQHDASTSTTPTTVLPTIGGVPWRKTSGDPASVSAENPPRSAVFRNGSLVGQRMANSRAIAARKTAVQRRITSMYFCLLYSSDA